MKCPHCGTENRPGLRFCEQCAAPLQAARPQGMVTCPACGAQNAPGLRFCEQCAAPLQAAPPPEAVTCPACGAQNVAGLRFCEQCAAPLTAPVPAAPAPAVEPPAAARPRRRWLRIALVGAPLLVILGAGLALGWPLLRGGELVQLSHRADLSQVTQQEATSIAVDLVEDSYPQLSGVAPVVQRSGGPGAPIYEVHFETERSVQGATLPWEVTVVVDGESNQILILESN